MEMDPGLATSFDYDYNSLQRCSGPIIESHDLIHAV